MNENGKTGNLVRSAIAAAGGTKAVAERFGASQAMVSRWWTRLAIPPHVIPALCEAGGNVISADDVSNYVVERLAERAANRARQRFMVDAALGRSKSPAGAA